MNWMAVIGASGACLFLSLAFHPFVTYPLSLWLLRKLGCGPAPLTTRTAAQATAAGAAAPDAVSVSIVFCAYNEATVIESKLANLIDLAGSYPAQQVELLAYCDAATDGTDRLMSNYASQVKITCGTVRRGKSHGMNTLLAQATGDVVIFTDANVMLDRQVVSAMLAAFADPEVGVACGHLRYINSDTDTAGVGTDYWRLEEFIKQLETDTGSTIGADGSLFAIRRQLWAPVPEDIIDDFYTSLRILCSGKRVVRCAAAVAYERSVDAFDQERARKTRIACRAYNCHRHLSAERRQLSWLNQYKYYSHKWLRWQSVTWLAGAALCAVAACGGVWGGWGAASAALCGLGGLVALWLAAKWGWPVCGKLWVALLSLWATQQGVWQSWRGQRYQTWTPAQSARVARTPQPATASDASANSC